MEFADLDLNKSYTFADYLKWNFNERVELIKGRIFKLFPAPAPIHQRISTNITTILNIYLKSSKCKVYPAPFDVRFPRKSDKDKDIITVLQPDISVVCDPTKIDGKGCLGAPDIVVEILSPSNNKKEQKFKHEVYEEGGVKEYWVVNPNERYILVYTLINGRLMASRPLYEEELLTSTALSGFSFTISEIFDSI